MSFDLAGRLILVTGSAGFIGSGFVRRMHSKHPSAQFLSLDKLTYAGNLENLSALHGSDRHVFLKGDVALEADVAAAFSLAASTFGRPVDAVVHFAAESHVDRSIEDPREFLITNVLGTETLLRVSRRTGVQRFLYVSTDEVYGTLQMEEPPFTESHPLQPNSPYSASKAAGDLMCRAYWETYRFPVLVSRCSNNYGPYQFPEKLIPLVIANAMEGREIPVYGQGLNVRDWIHVDDHSDGIEAILTSGREGEAYNLGGECERSNISVVREILANVGADEGLIRYVSDRPGHDLRYAMDIQKVRQELGWSPKVSFERGLSHTVDWYRENRAWVDHVRSGEYRDFYDRLYSGRISGA